MLTLVALGVQALAATPIPLPAPQRAVAPVVAAAWSNEAARDRAGEARDVIRLTGIRAGSTVADIGAGSGYHVMRIAPVVGASGRVIAQDVEPRFLDALRDRVRRAGLRNVAFVLGSAGDARLPAGSVDVALMVHMYHEIAQPYQLLDRLRASLKPGGRIAIVDLDRPAEMHGMPKALLVCEMKAVGYDLIGVTDIAQGYVAQFRPGARPDPASVKACRG